MVDGTILNCVVGDTKNNKDTDSRNIQAKNGNIVEFIVDTRQMNRGVKKSGTISTIDGFGGGVKQVLVYDDVAEAGIVMEAVDKSVNSVKQATVKEDTASTVIETQVVEEIEEAKKTPIAKKTEPKSIEIIESPLVFEKEEPKIEVFETVDVEMFITHSPEDEVVFLY